MDALGDIVRQAASPSRGWAAACAQAAEILGARVLDPLRELPLADDALRLRAWLAALRRERPMPRRVDTLAFSVAPRRRGPPALAVAVELWQGGELALDALDAVHRAAAGERARSRREALRGLELVAAGLAARFGAEELRYRVVVGRAGEVPVEVLPPLAARRASRRT